MRSKIEVDDYKEFDVTFEKFQESMTQLKAEIKKMVINNHSDKEIEKVIKNGALALTTMSFNIKDVKVESGFGLHLVQSTLKTCNDMAFGYLKQEILKNNQ